MGNVKLPTNSRLRILNLNIDCSGDSRSRNLEPAFYAICVVELLNEIYRAIIAVYTTRTYVRTRAYVYS